jgi:hypothetical protein
VDLVTSEGDTADEEPTLSFQERLSAIMTSSSSEEKNSLTTPLTDEIKACRTTGALSSRLEKLFYIMNHAPLTSVSAERCFSSAGQLKTKLRSKMNDETLNALCVLKCNKKYLT